jgi:hypothetical protein
MSPAISEENIIRAANLRARLPLVDVAELLMLGNVSPEDAFLLARAGEWYLVHVVGEDVAA